jgi:hypothetical protein
VRAAKFGAVSRVTRVGEALRPEGAIGRRLPRSVVLRMPTPPGPPRPADVPKTVPRLPNGSFPRNAHLAGKEHPVTKTPFDKKGQPDLSSIRTAPVKIRGGFTTRPKDFAKANAKAGLPAKPTGRTWHHRADGKTLDLVDTKVHAKVGHTGGFAISKQQAAAAAAARPAKVAVRTAAGAAAVSKTSAAPPAPKPAPTALAAHHPDLPRLRPVSAPAPKPPAPKSRPAPAVKAAPPAPKAQAAATATQKSNQAAQATCAETRTRQTVATGKRK